MVGNQNKAINYPSPSKVQDYIKSKVNILKKHSNIVLECISGVTRLRWLQEPIICYFVGYCTPFSDPLTLMSFESDDVLLDIFIHELIHRIQTQNPIKTAPTMMTIRKKFKDETVIT